MDEQNAWIQSKTQLNWEGDALGRKSLADFLTQSIVGRTVREKVGKGITIALDGDWGAGKTFFVKQWIQDLEKSSHPVVYFDAWENDIGDAASVALMACMLKGLEGWEKKLPRDQKTKRTFNELREGSIKALRKAIVPVSTIVAKGLIKKFSGIALEEIGEIFEKANESPETDSEPKNEIVDEALDKLFEQTLEDHNSRKGSLAEFRRTIADLIRLLSEHTECNVPLFVFVDELDRCRPSYAVKLLEEIKHIFGIPSVVYIVSTNLEQLQSSVRAIYGSEFDGRRYLRRIFDQEYVLPKANNKEFAEALLRESILVERLVVSGLPEHAPEEQSINGAWALVSDAFDLGRDLRAQKQIISLLEEVVLSFPENKAFHALWLFYLGALFYIDRPALEKIETGRLSLSAFRELVEKSVKQNPEIHYYGSSGSPSSELNSVALSKVLAKYYEYSIANSKKLQDYRGSTNLYDYPANIIDMVIADISWRPKSSNEKGPSIREYARLIRSAGYLMGSKD